MNIIGQPDVYAKPFSKWFEQNITSLLDRTPAYGEVKVRWHTTLAQVEQSGEICSVERWNGQTWEQYGLDAHSTVEDLYALNEKLGVEL